MIEIKYFENWQLLETIEFADMEEANDEMYSLFFNSYSDKLVERVERGFATREEIVEFLNNCEGGDLFRFEIHPQSSNWEFV